MPKDVFFIERTLGSVRKTDPHRVKSRQIYAASEGLPHINGDNSRFCEVALFLHVK